MIRVVVSIDSVRVFIRNTLHVHVPRAAYRGLNAWRMPNEHKWAIEISLADTEPMFLEYDTEAKWKAVLKALDEELS